MQFTQDGVDGVITKEALSSEKMGDGKRSIRSEGNRTER